MLRVFWVHGCEPGRVSDGSRLALCQTLSIECPSFIFFWHVCFVIPVPFSFSFFVCLRFFFCSHWSLVDVPLIFFCPADHVPDWQPRVLLGMVEARSVNVKKTTTTTTVVNGLLERKRIREASTKLQREHENKTKLKQDKSDKRKEQ